MNIDWNTIISIALGAVITWLAAHAYYKRATKDLNQAVAEIKFEAAELKRLSVLMLRAIEATGQVDLAKNPDGHPVGIHHRYQVTESGAEVGLVSAPFPQHPKAG